MDDLQWEELLAEEESSGGSDLFCALLLGDCDCQCYWVKFILLFIGFIIST